MPNPTYQIDISKEFTSDHEQALTAYIYGTQPVNTASRQILYEAIDILIQSKVLLGKEIFTFREIYNKQIDSRFAAPYFKELLTLTDIPAQSPPLIAKYAKQIASTLKQAELLIDTMPQSIFLYAYCVYWWQSFARGYAFEIEIMHDLEGAQIDFSMHNLLSENERYSKADLVVLDLLGDIKTSTYFLQQQSSGPLANDFYITRLYEQGRSRTLVIFQKSHAWARIGGAKTIPGNMSTVLNLLPKAVQLEQLGVKLIVIEYADWKQMVRHVQQQERK